MHLATFETEVVFLSTTPVDIVLTLLQSPCLRNLKKFAISNFEGPPIDQDDANAIDRYCSLVFDAFTSILRSVEKVRAVTHRLLHVFCENEEFERSQVECVF